MITTLFANYTNKGIIVFLFVTMLATGLVVPANLEAAANLVDGSSFEGDIYDDWSLFVSPDTPREFSFYRSLDRPYGYGTYAAAIMADTAGTPAERWMANITSEQSFNTVANAEYYISFMAKSGAAMPVGIYVQNATNYNRVTPVSTFTVNGDWRQYSALVTVQTGGQSVITFDFGGIPTGAELLVDGISFSQNDLNFDGAEVRGHIGERDKALRVTGIENFDLEDIEVELPYFDNETMTPTTRRYNPASMSRNAVSIHMYEQTFSGIGTLYVNDIELGSFNYTVEPRIEALEPAMVRANEDITLIGSGFNPLIDESKMFIVLKTIDVEGNVSERWLQPHTIDSRLTRVTATAPFGVASDRIFVQTNYYNNNNENIVNKSNLVNYSVKPIIDSIEWQDRGFEQVGDRLLIRGRGISYRPTVNFYDAEGNLIDSERATVERIYNEEVISAQSTSRVNSYEITVTAGGIESDRDGAITYSAKPRMTDIRSDKNRTLYASDETIPAAKIGEEITIRGAGLRDLDGDTIVEFEGINGRIPAVAVTNDRGNQLAVTVPAGAQNGYLGVIANEEVSNYLPLEIIPTVNSVSPSPVVPGEQLVIRANGIGSNLDLTRVYFELDPENEVDVRPEAIVFQGNEALVYVTAPKSMSNNSTKVNLQYDRWRNDGESVLNVRPHIERAAINLDNKILSIRGYGFSINPRENIITYRYADEDQTVINPRVRLLGVYPTEEGQEIRVQILDDYHYGYVQVQVGEYQSNQVQFGPVYVSQVARRVEFVESENQVMGVLYINGYNFGEDGEVTVGGRPAITHYRSNFFIIAVIDEQYLHDDPVEVNRD